MTHIAYFYNNVTDIDDNTGQSIQDYMDNGYASGESGEDKFISRPLEPGETVETAPDIVVNGEAIPKTGFTPPSIPTPPL